MARGKEYWRNRARYWAKRRGINPDIYERQIRQESGFQTQVGSPAGAIGIAQIVPRWHPGVNPRDPEASLKYSTAMMAKNVKKFGWRDALAMYNSGRHWNVSKGFSETRGYVHNILGGYHDVKNAVPGGKPRAKDVFKPARGKIRTAPFVPIKNRSNTNQAVVNYALAASKAYVEGDNFPDAMSMIKGLRQERPPVVKVGGEPLPRTSPKAPTEVPGGRVPGKPQKGAQAVLAAIRQAQRMGLSVRENPYVDHVDPVHTTGSDHYKNYAGKYKGRKVGHAIDVSGAPKKMNAYYSWLEGRRKNMGLDDMFYDPRGYSYDEGGRWNKTIGGHSDHVHASFF